MEPDGEVEPGDYPVTIELSTGISEDEPVRRTQTVRILPGYLPHQALIHTKWFHYDGLSHYYHVPVFSEEHWRITENFMRAAVKRGINMIMMPTHTPPLDTRVGTERLTVQLVDVYVNNGVYAFGFDKLRRWVDMAERCGVEYYEIAHFFTQWGAHAAPKIMATVDGVSARAAGRAERARCGQKVLVPCLRRAERRASGQLSGGQGAHREAFAGLSDHGRALQY